MKKVNESSSSRDEWVRPLTRSRSGGQPHVRVKEVMGVKLSREEKELIDAGKASSSSSVEEEEAGSPYDEDDEDYQDSEEGGSVEAPVKRQTCLVVREEKALAKVAPRKEVGKMTFIDIIEDTKSGIPARSEVESRDKRAFLRKQGDALSS